MAAGALLVTGPMTLAGCTVSVPTAPDEPDPLAAPAQRAEADVALAQALDQAIDQGGAGEQAELATAARMLAADRQAHANALRAELRRANPGADPSSSAPVPPPAPVIAGSDRAGAREALATAIRAAQQEAAGLVATLPGFRAALLASVAACCASHAEMLP